MKSNSSSKLLYEGKKWDQKKAALEANPTFRHLYENWHLFEDPAERAKEVAALFREFPYLSARFAAFMLHVDDKTVDKDLKVGRLNHQCEAHDQLEEVMEMPDRPSNAQTSLPDHAPMKPPPQKPEPDHADPLAAHQDHAFLDTYRLPNIWGF